MFSFNLKTVASVFAMLLLSGLCAQASNDDLERIQSQFCAFQVSQGIGATAVQVLIEQQSVTGTWDDIDYSSQRRSEWPTLKHLKRVQDLVTAYSDSKSLYYKKASLKQSIVRGLDHWIDTDYQNPNWWYARIGVPKTLGASLVMMGDELPKKTREAAEPIMRRCSMGLTGQNRVWCAGNSMMIGWLYGDPELMDKAVDSIWQELRVSAKEGIQADWSFHQHGAQQQFGNYGRSFAGDMIQWAMILRGTKYALSDEKLAILRNYMLHGVSWVIWNGFMDFSGCGRQIGKDEPRERGRDTILQLQTMPDVDPEFADQYAAVLERSGFQAFWRSEMAVQRRPEWYASVKMSSKRVIGTESFNSENMQGLHLGDGVLLVSSSGTEYENMVPLWDWKRLPGTTCDQGLNDLAPTRTDFGGSNFSGVMGVGEIGLAAMIYKRGCITARKSWFFWEDHVVCLGAGISGETLGSVFTSVEQSRGTGEVTCGSSWIQHAGICYQILDGKPVVKYETIDGNWINSFPTRGDRPVSGRVLSIWIDHGESPKNETYAYRIFPDIEGHDRKALFAKSVVISNTEKIQAVANGHKAFAVFYQAGEVQLGKAWSIQVDGPCLMQRSGDVVWVADPTKSLNMLNVTLNGTLHQVELPKGMERGKAIIVE